MLHIHILEPEEYINPDINFTASGFYFSLWNMNGELCFIAENDPEGLWEENAKKMFRELFQGEPEGKDSVTILDNKNICIFSLSDCCKASLILMYYYNLFNGTAVIKAKQNLLDRKAWEWFSSNTELEIFMNLEDFSEFLCKGCSENMIKKDGLEVNGRIIQEEEFREVRKKYYQLVHEVSLRSEAYAYYIRYGWFKKSSYVKCGPAEKKSLAEFIGLFGKNADSADWIKENGDYLVVNTCSGILKNAGSEFVFLYIWTRENGKLKLKKRTSAKNPGFLDVIEQFMECRPHEGNRDAFALVLYDDESVNAWHYTEKVWFRLRADTQRKEIYVCHKDAAVEKFHALFAQQWEERKKDAEDGPKEEQVRVVIEKTEIKRKLPKAISKKIPQIWKNFGEFRRILGMYYGKGKVDAALLRQLKSLEKNCRKNHEFSMYVRQLLMIAESRDDRESFCRLLDLVPHMGHLNYYLKPEDKLHFDMCMPNRKISAFLTEKEEFLDLITERFGIDHQVHSSGRIYYNDCGQKPLDGNAPYVSKKEELSLPDTYIAVLFGNIKMARYYYRHGAYRTVRCRDLDVHGDEREVRGNRVEYEQYGSLLKAAYASKNEEMIDFVIDLFSDEEWCRELSIEAARRGTGAVEKLFRKYPNAVELAEVRPFIFAANITFLKKAAEQKESWRRLEEKTVEELGELDGEEWKSSVEADGRRTEEFYRYFLEHIQMPETRKVLRAFLIKVISVQKKNAGLPFLLLLEGTEEGEDFTELFFPSHGIFRAEPNRAIFQMVSQSHFSRKIPIDLYKIKAGGYISENAFSSSFVRMIFEKTVPIQVKPCADLFLRYVILSKDAEILELGIRSGFVTSVNAPKLLREDEVKDEEKKRILMELVGEGDPEEQGKECEKAEDPSGKEEIVWFT